MKGFRFASYISSSFPKLLVAITSSGAGTSACRTEATSRRLVATTASSAAGIGAMPVPFADAAMLMPMQVAMVAGITATCGLSFSEGFLSMLVASMVGGTAAMLTGPVIVGSLLKLIPGIGSVVGGAISAATAATVTRVFGETYIAALDALFARHQGEPPSQQEVLEEFRRRFTGM